MTEKSDFGTFGRYHEVPVGTVLHGSATGSLLM